MSSLDWRSFEAPGCQGLEKGPQLMSGLMSELETQLTRAFQERGDPGPPMPRRTGPCDKACPPSRHFADLSGTENPQLIQELLDEGRA